MDKSQSRSKTPQYSDFNNFLYKHKNPKNSSNPITHTSFGDIESKIYAGSYCIDGSEDVNRFLRLYTKHVGDKKQPAYMIERHLENVSKIVIDFDFRHDGNVKRQYDEEIMTKAVIMIQNEINSMMNNTLNDARLKAMIMEKPEARFDEKKNITKDGLHIIFPNLVTNFSFQYALRYRMINNSEFKKLFEDIHCSNPVSDIYDKSVIEKNGWMMYGSHKINGKPYTCDYYIDGKGKKQKNTYNFRDMVLVNSIRINRNKDYLTTSRVNDEQKELLHKIETEFKTLPDSHKEKKMNKTKTHVKKRTPGKKKIATNDEEFENAQSLTSMLSRERANSYESWIRVGWCLHNIDYRLLEDWIKFSKKVPEKFEEGVCENEWDYMNDDGLNIGTLYRWAKEDNPSMFDRFMQTRIDHAISQSLSGLPNDVARVIYTKYKNKYVCVNIKKKGWYRFLHHRWEPDEEGISLKQKLSNDIVILYKEFSSKLHTQAARMDIDESAKDLALEKAKKVDNVIALLKKTSFKKNIMEECSEFFYNKEFEEKLDSNVNLLGFDNGVYDLKNGVFRKGEPEDMITFTTRINYVKYDEKSDTIKSIKDFMAQILPYPNVRKYMMTFLSLCLCGKNVEKFHILTGGGGNGKSKLIELFRFCIGDYATGLPVAIITQARGRGEGASPALASTKGKRFAVMQEPETGVCLNNGLMKELTGGDIIKARSLFANFEEFKPQFKLVLICNEMPEVNASDRGTWRRIRVVNFPSKFLEDPNPSNPLEFKIDYELDERLSDWKEAFMYMLLQIYEDYKKNGITEPKEVTNATNEYKCDTDNFSQYIDEFYEINKEYKSSKMLISDIYKHYKNWYENMKNGKPPKSSQLRAAMEAKFGKYQNGFKGLIRKVPQSQHNSESEDEMEEEI